MSKQNTTKVVTGINTRFSYFHGWDPVSINGGAEKYSVSVLIPKDDTETIEAIEKAIDASISGPEATGCILYESAAEGYKDWNDQLLGKRIKPEKDNLDDWEISGKATLNHALSDLPEVNPEHIRNGLYDEADHEAVRKRLERADRVIFSFETNDQGMSDKGFRKCTRYGKNLPGWKWI